MPVTTTTLLRFPLPVLVFTETTHLGMFGPEPTRRDDESYDFILACY